MMLNLLKDIFIVPLKEVLGDLKILYYIQVIDGHVTILNSKNTSILNFDSSSVFQNLSPNSNSDYLIKYLEQEKLDLDCIYCIVEHDITKTIITDLIITNEFNNDFTKVNISGCVVGYNIVYIDHIPKDKWSEVLCSLFKTSSSELAIQRLKSVTKSFKVINGYTDFYIHVLQNALESSTSSNKVQPDNKPVVKQIFINNKQVKILKLL